MVWSRQAANAFPTPFLYNCQSPTTVFSDLIDGSKQTWLLCALVARPPHFNARLPPQSSRREMPVGERGGRRPRRRPRPPFRPPNHPATHPGLVGADDSAVAVSAVTLSGRWARCHSWSLMAAVMERSPPKFNTQRRQRHQAALQRLALRALF